MYILRKYYLDEWPHRFEDEFFETRKEAVDRMVQLKGCVATKIYEPMEG